MAGGRRQAMVAVAVFVCVGILGAALGGMVGAFSHPSGEAASFAALEAVALAVLAADLLALRAVGAIPVVLKAFGGR